MDYYVLDICRTRGITMDSTAAAKHAIPNKDKFRITLMDDDE